MNFFAAHGYKFQIFSAEKQYVNVRLKDFVASFGAGGLWGSATDGRVERGRPI